MNKIIPIIITPIIITLALCLCLLAGCAASEATGGNAGTSPVAPAETIDADDSGESSSVSNEINAADELKSILVGTWSQINGVYETAAMPNTVEFAADGSCVYCGYESVAYGIYEIGVVKSARLEIATWIKQIRL